MSENIQPRDLFGFDACDTSQPFVFVSYAHADAEKIAPYVSFLAKNNISVWYDNGLRPGQKWLEMLLTRISLPTCMAVLFFVSAESISSPFVRAETEQAFKTRKPIYGIYLEDGLSLDVEMNAYISRIQSTFISRHSSLSTAQNEILLAAIELMRGEAPGVLAGSGSSNRYDDDLRKAELLINHTRFDGTHDRVEEAQEIFRDLSQQNMTDYRGWYGLLRCVCLQKPETPEAATEQIKSALDYHSYAVNCSDSPELREQCVEALDFLWSCTLDIFDDYIKRRESTDIGEIRAFAALLPDSRMLRHVSPATTARYTETANRFESYIGELVAEEERRQAEIEAAKRRKAEELRLEEERKQALAEAQRKKEEAARLQAEREAEEALLQKEKDRKSTKGIVWRSVLCGLLFLSVLSISIAIIEQEFAWPVLKAIEIPAALGVMAAVALSAIASHRSAQYGAVPSPKKHRISMIALTVCSVLLLFLPIGLEINTEPITIGKVTYDVCISDGSGCCFAPVDSSSTSVTIRDRVLGAPVTRSYYSNYLNCDNIQELHCSPRSSRFTEIDGVLFSKDKFTLLMFPSGRKGHYNVPQGTKTIGESAFWRCQSLESVTLPDSVSTIDINAFYYCTGLRSIVIPNSVTTIRYCAFERCTSLKSITIPDSVNYLGSYVFHECTDLEHAVLPAGITEIPWRTFSECHNLKTVVIPDGITTIYHNAFESCHSLKTVEIPDSVTSIGEEAFKNCLELEKIIIPASVTSIESDVFYYCSDLYVICPRDSAAWKYCEENNIPHVEQESDIPAEESTESVEDTDASSTEEGSGPVAIGGAGSSSVEEG